MKIVIVSNFLNHHFLPLCNSFRFIRDVELFFVATEETPAEKIKLGYDNMNDKYSFVVKAYKNNSEYRKALLVLNECDIAFFDGVWGKLLKNCLNNKKIVFRFSERFHKKNKNILIEMVRTMKYKYLSTKDKNSILLVAGLYAATDFGATNYKRNMFKFGYFPPFVRKQYKEIVTLKKRCSIVWVGRFIDWKHPEFIIKLAKSFLNNKQDFSIDVVGDGPLFKDFCDEIINEGLDRNVAIYGSQPFAKVREIMDKNVIHIFTSDQNEGWGAVLNESMNSFCIPVANQHIGAASYLIKNKFNGMIYDGTFSDFYNKVTYILRMSNSEINNMQKNAYDTVFKLWNSDVAANRIVEFYNALSHNKELPCYDEGPLSKAG